MEERDANEGSLDKVDQLATAGTLVVITLAEVNPRISVPRGYLTDGFLAGRKPDEAFTVYHLQISRVVLP